jgi:hypothetical protein
MVFILPIAIGMIFSVTANGQIVYTDVNPDLVKSCSGSSGSAMDSIDINNDGLFDLKLNLGVSYTTLSHGYIRSGFVRATPLNGSEIITDTAGYPYPLYMNLNDVISTGSTTSAVLGLILISRSVSNAVGYTSTTGNWTTSTDGFLGLRIVSGGQTYFGWVELNAIVVAANSPASATITIKSYAYNSIPNQPILAGQTTATGIIENSFASSINLYPNPATNHLTIALGSNIKKVEVSIADITGKVIYSTTKNDPDSPESYRDREQKIEVNTQDFAKGIYIVQIQTADFIETKKLVVEK